MRKLVGIAIALFAMAIGPASAQERTEAAAFAAGSSLTTDPLIQIYRFTGLRDNGGATGVGIAVAHESGREQHRQPGPPAARATWRAAGTTARPASRPTTTAAPRQVRSRKSP